MDTIIFNFQHTFQGTRFDVEAEVIAVNTQPRADSDWDAMNYFSVETVAVNGVVLEDNSQLTLGLTDKEIERQFDSYVATTRTEFEILEGGF